MMRSDRIHGVLTGVTLVVIVAIFALAAAAVVGCSGNGDTRDTREDTFPYHAGTVIDRKDDQYGWALKLRTLVDGEQHTGWQPVSTHVAAFCGIGDFWQEDEPDGC